MPKDQKRQTPEFPDIDGFAVDDDDDEIVDLLEVVKPGKGTETKGSGSDIDFSADLDAMLAKLEDAEKALDAVAAPFPDPTPVDHLVDPDETLDMPSMDDLNNLLETLGAAVNTPEKSAAGEKPSLTADLDAAPIMEQLTPAPSTAAGLADPDDLFAQAQAAAVAAPKKSAPAELDFDGILAQAQAAPKAAPAASGGQPDLDDLFAQAQAADAAPAAAPTPERQKPLAPAAPVASGGQPNLDALLAEVDAADMTAPAPKKPAPPVADPDDLFAQAQAAAAAAPQAAPPAPAKSGGQPDLDDLFAQAAAADPAPKAAPAAPGGQPDFDDILAQAKAAPVPDDILEVPMDLDDLPMAALSTPAATPAPQSDPDDLFAQAQAAAAAPAATEAAPSAPAKSGGQPDLDDLFAQAAAAPAEPDSDDLFAQAQAAAAPKAAPPTPANSGGQPDLDALLAEAAAAPKAAPAAPSGQPDFDDILAQAEVAPVPDDIPEVPMDLVDLDDLPSVEGSTALAESPDLDALIAEAPAAPVLAGGEPEAEALLAEADSVDMAAFASEQSEDAVQAAEPVEAPQAGDVSLVQEIPEPAAPPKRPAQKIIATVVEMAPLAASSITTEIEPEVMESPPVDSLPQPSTAPRYDEVDLNELDALLDDMLASAPAPGPMVSSEVPAQAASLTNGLTGGSGDASMSLAPVNIAPLQEAVIRMENSIQALQSDLQEKNALIEAQQVLIGELKDTLDSIRDNMDKIAAEAAAKVIREELAVLLQDL